MYEDIHMCTHTHTHTHTFIYIYGDIPYTLVLTSFFSIVCGLLRTKGFGSTLIQNTSILSCSLLRTKGFGSTVIQNASILRETTCRVG